MKKIHPAQLTKSENLTASTIILLHYDKRDQNHTINLICLKQ